jgi:hypothetical protein
LGQIARAFGANPLLERHGMLALSDNAAITTARQSENAPKASDAATASINRGEATLALRPPKPCAPGERIMAKIPWRLRANHPQCCGNRRFSGRQYCGSSAPNSPQALMVVND